MREEIHFPDTRIQKLSKKFKKGIDRELKLRYNNQAVSASH